MYGKPITHLHLEPTSDCNARCPQCPRNWKGTLDTAKWLNVTEWSKDELDSVLNQPELTSVKHVAVNGNYGDIVKHSDPKGLLQTIINKNHILQIKVNTNGGALNKEFWRWLATHRKVHVEFGIDGLEDTHHLYRRNTRYDVVISNAKEYINAGGRAIWMMNVFKHNEHQVEDCKLLAQEYGFLNFTYRPSHRWVQDYTPVFDKNKKEEYRIYPASVVEEKGITKFFEPPKAPPPNSHIKYDVETANDLPTPNNKCNIECKVLPINGSVNNSIYLAADGRIWPCCWTASHHDRMLSQNFKDDFIKEFYQKKGYKQNFNNTKIHTIKKIFQTEMFDFYPKTWPKDNPHPACRYSCDVKSNFNIQENLTNGSSFK